MKYILLLTLILYTQAQDGSNASNTTGNGNETNITTTTLRGVTTTLGPTTTGSPTTAMSTTSQAIKTETTTPWPMGTTTVNYTTTTVPYCSDTTKNSSCKVCLGPLCKFVERGEQGIGWEILFVAFAMGIIGVGFLGIWYICLRPILHQNTAEDILWISDSSDEEDWHETASMLSNEDIRKKRSREFEIVDLNPVNK